MAQWSASADEEEALLEFHFDPVPGAQIAIWLEDEDGNFIADVFVTQSVGKLGIGNRPGLWDFVSSWRAPYGPRKSTLPIWGHRRGKTYPEIIFHHDNPEYTESLGYHESTSSAEPYHCRPLTPDENVAIMDTLTCPSPAVFRSDKGRFSPGGGTSVYPPRSNIVGFDDTKDHPDIMQYPELNELADAVTGATPASGQTLETYLFDRDLLPESGLLVAFVEINLEHDENAEWDFDREDDHFVDPKLAAYGVEYLGQPSIVYRVEFDPSVEGHALTPEYHGYSDWDGDSGTIHAPDSTISTSGGSGADRLRLVDGFDGEYRFAVVSHGFSEAGEEGPCDEVHELLPVEHLEVEPVAFDRVAVAFDMPEVAEGTPLKQLRIWYQTPATSMMDVDVAQEAPSHAFCSDSMQSDECLSPEAGERVEIEVGQLFGNYTYTIGVGYDDLCRVRSPVSAADVTTPIQEFQTLEGFCFVATAAYGGQWVEEVAGMRWFRDVVLRRAPLGEDAIRFYYAYGPSLARTVASRPWLRAAIRGALQPLADATKLGRSVHRRLSR